MLYIPVKLTAAFDFWAFFGRYDKAWIQKNLPCLKKLPVASLILNMHFQFMKWLLTKHTRDPWNIQYFFLQLLLLCLLVTYKRHGEKVGERNNVSVI